MHTIISGLYLFFDVLYYAVWIDVILSWLTLVGVYARPQIIADILDPFYEVVRKFLPTRFGILDLSALFTLILIGCIQLLLLFVDPSLIGLRALLANIF